MKTHSSFFSRKFFQTLAFNTFVLFYYKYIKMASIATKFRPLFDRVLVKRLDALKQSKGGIMLPESASKKILEATVIAVGPGARNQDGKSIPIDVKVGDRVLLPEYGGTKIQLDEDDSYTIFKESELLAKVEDN